MSLRTAVLIPCYNEEATVADVVAMARKALPDAAVYVYDNNSTDLSLIPICRFLLKERLCSRGRAAA